MESNTENTISIFLSSLGVLPETDPDILDDIDRLDMDLYAPITDFEPYLGEPDSDTNMKEMLRKRRALVIDDSLSVCCRLSQALNELGYEVVQAGDGMEGLKELQQSLYDIVFCEITLPVMDGVM
jgi:Response regulator receiver domain